MGMGGISIWQLLIILLIVVLLFGTKKLKNIGTDLGNAIKGFRSAVNDGEKKDGDTHDGAAASTARVEASPSPATAQTARAGDQVTPSKS